MSVLVFDVNKYSFKVIRIMVSCYGLCKDASFSAKLYCFCAATAGQIPIAKVKIETNPNLATRHSKQGHGHYVSYCLGREGSLVKRYEVLQEL
jgi:hypothetical protein